VAGFHVQNPDPKAHKYFAEHITKAYQALTDEVSRQNYEKYGHPDGPQVGVGERSKGRPRVQWRCAVRSVGTCLDPDVGGTGGSLQLHRGVGD